MDREHSINHSKTTTMILVISLVLAATLLLLPFLTGNLIETNITTEDTSPLVVPTLPAE